MSRTNKPTDVFKHIDMSGGPDSCWPWTGGLNAKGRPYFSINGKKDLAYRIVWRLVKGEDLGQRLYRHTCDNEICCNPAHGIPGDHNENMTDMKERERHGMSHHMARFIKKQIDKGYDDKLIAEITGAGVSTIADIRSGRTFSHVDKASDQDGNT